MSNFAAKNLSLGQVNALVKKLGGETSALAILDGTLTFTLEVAEDMPYNGSRFFWNRDGLWVDSSLDRAVGLDGHTTCGAVPCGRTLGVPTSEVVLFGKVGSVEHAATLKNAVDLGQIEMLINAQWGGKSGILLTNNRANIFPVVGKDGKLRIVIARLNPDDSMWRVYCTPLSFDRVHVSGDQVFSN